ncbi:hypothetical protein ACIPEQ_03950 [Curtobacterium sp. NPDC087080]|uniref:hypothetical protein n=1 Tax=Curtobacterium sp. NPDC087080 TaxID=3363965 RepID=UPI003823E17F
MHDWYDWVKDIGLPLLTGGGSVVVGVAALRVARRGHQLAAEADSRESRSRRFEARNRAAAELLDLVRVREWVLTDPGPKIGPLGLAEIRPGTIGHRDDREEQDIISAATTLAASLDEDDRLGFDWALNLIQEIIKPANVGQMQVMVTTIKLSVERWVTNPQAFLNQMRSDWPQLDPT